MITDSNEPIRDAKMRIVGLNAYLVVYRAESLMYSSLPSSLALTRMTLTRMRDSCVNYCGVVIYKLARNCDKIVHGAMRALVVCLAVYLSAVIIYRGECTFSSCLITTVQAGWRCYGSASLNVSPLRGFTVRRPNSRPWPV